MRHMTITAVAVLTIGQLASARGVLFVDDDAAAGGDGLGWDIAYRFLQDALTFASDPANGITEIRVGQGTYEPDRDENNPDGTGDREATFILINGLSLLGGYAGIGAEDPDARDIELYETVLSGDHWSYHIVTSVNLDLTSIEGFTLSGGYNDNEDDSNGSGAAIFVDGGSASIARCVIMANESTEHGAVYVLDATNVLLEDCILAENESCCFGGALTVEASSCDIVDCEFVNNLSDAGGAMALTEKSSATLENCEFIGNAALLSSSGAMQICTGSTTSINHCAFSQNAAVYDAGALKIRGDTIVSIFDCDFIENTVEDGEGGGMFVESNATLDVSESRFLANVADCGGAAFLQSNVDATFTECLVEANVGRQTHAGFVTSTGAIRIDKCIFDSNTVLELWTGALSVESFDAVVSNCFFINNSAPESIGAMAVQRDALIINCVFVGNTAGDGAAIWVFDSTSQFVNCIVAGNHASSMGGGITSYGFQNTISIDNCILWGNSDSTGSGESAQLYVEDHDSEIELNYSCVQGLTGIYGGEGNIDADPLLVDLLGEDGEPGTGDEDLRLLAGSPCIDAGDNTQVPIDVITDLDGNPRFVDDPKTEDTGVGRPPIIDMGAYEFQGAVECPWDLHGDGFVGPGDLLILLGWWGFDPGGPPDFNGDGVVDTTDLIELIGNWGPCPK